MTHPTPCPCPECVAKYKAIQVDVLTPEELHDLFDDLDPSLWGNKLAELTKALGVPPCPGCDARRKWINKAHRLLAGKNVVTP